MSKTLKRALWQRTLETAGPLRKALPVAMSQEMEGFFCRMQAIVDRGEERRRQQARAERHRADFKAWVNGVLAEAVPAWKPVPGGPEHHRRLTVTLGMDFAAGGVLDQTVYLVGECEPEVVLTIPAGGLKVGEPVSFSQYADLFLLALPQMVGEINEDPKP
jgi:hypothetical protein